MNKLENIFIVGDNQTYTAPDIQKIITTEKWAQGLDYLNIIGFALTEDGNLVMLDKCGNVRYCPGDRFDIIFPKIEGCQGCEDAVNGCENTIRGCPFDKMDEWAIMRRFANE